MIRANQQLLVRIASDSFAWREMFCRCSVWSLISRARLQAGTAWWNRTRVVGVVVVVEDPLPGRTPLSPLWAAAPFPWFQHDWMTSCWPRHVTVNTLAFTLSQHIYVLVSVMSALHGVCSNYTNVAESRQEQHSDHYWDVACTIQNSKLFFVGAFQWFKLSRCFCIVETERHCGS